MAFRRRSYGTRRRGRPAGRRYGKPYRSYGRRRSNRARMSRLPVKSLALACAKTMAEKKATTVNVIRELDEGSQPTQHQRVHESDNGTQFDFHVSTWGWYNGMDISMPVGFSDFNPLDCMKFPHIAAFGDDEFNKRIGRELFYRKSYIKMDIVMNTQNTTGTLSTVTPPIGDPYSITQWDGLPTRFRVFHFAMKSGGLYSLEQNWDPSKDIFMDHPGEGSSFFGPTSVGSSGASPPTQNTPIGLENAMFNHKKYTLIKEWKFTLDNPQRRPMSIDDLNTVQPPGANRTLVGGFDHSIRADYPTRKSITFTHNWNQKMKFETSSDVEPYDRNWQRFCYIVAYKIQGERAYLVGSSAVDPAQELQGLVANSTVPPNTDQFRVYVQGSTTAYDM